MYWLHFIYIFVVVVIKTRGSSGRDDRIDQALSGLAYWTTTDGSELWKSWGSRFSQVGFSYQSTPSKYRTNVHFVMYCLWSKWKQLDYRIQWRGVHQLQMRREEAATFSKLYWKFSYFSEVFVRFNWDMWILKLVCEPFELKEWVKSWF